MDYLELPTAQTMPPTPSPLAADNVSTSALEAALAKLRPEVQAGLSIQEWYDALYEVLSILTMLAENHESTLCTHARLFNSMRDRGVL